MQLIWSFLPLAGTMSMTLRRNSRRCEMQSRAFLNHKSAMKTQKVESHNNYSLKILPSGSQQLHLLKTKMTTLKCVSGIGQIGLHLNHVPRCKMKRLTSLASYAIALVDVFPMISWMKCQRPPKLPGMSYITGILTWQPGTRRTIKHCNILVQQWIQNSLSFACVREIGSYKNLQRTGDILVVR